MQSPQAKLKEINRLLSAFPPGNWVDPEEAMRGYLLAVEDYPADDVETAVTALIKGIAPGVNPSFLPPPAAVGAECHRQNHLRCTREARDKALQPKLPPPMIEHTPESRAAIKAMVDGLVERNAERRQLETDARPKSDLWAKTNARFAPDMDPDAMKQRLGFTAGDPDGAADAA